MDYAEDLVGFSNRFCWIQQAIVVGIQQKFCWIQQQILVDSAKIVGIVLNVAAKIFVQPP